MTSFEKVSYIFENYLQLILYSLCTTLILAIFGTVVGLFFGIFLAYGKNITIKETDNHFIKVVKYICKYFCSFYSLVFRGTPMMVQALIIFYLSQNIGINWNVIMRGSSAFYNVLNGNLICGLIVITLNTAAYMCEIMRSGLNSVDKGQIEAARSLGMSEFKISFYVVLPQALKNAIPTIGNELIINIKDSSVLNVISVTDLYYRFNSTIANATYSFMECYLILAVIYLLLTCLAALILKIIEKKLDGVKFSLNPFRIFRKKQA